MPRLKAFLLLLSILTLWLSSGFLHFDIPYENASKYEWRMARVYSVLYVDDVTLADLEEAHELAVENMASIWSI